MTSLDKDYQEFDWVKNKQWQTNNISSLSLYLQRQKRKITIFFSILFLLAAVPSLNAMLMGHNSGIWLVAIILFIPFLYAWYDYLKSKFDYKRFGDGQCLLTPFPGKIGAKLGGQIKLTGEFPHDGKYRVSLHYNNKKRWNITENIAAQPTIDGVSLDFLFDVPLTIPMDPYNSCFFESSSREGIHRWIILVSFEYSNEQFYLIKFNIPVYN